MSTTKEIVHRRLYAFFNSQVLNALYLVGLLLLLPIGYLQSLLLPTICGAPAFALFIGYSLWLWIKKPKQIVINTWLSNMTTWYTIYFLAVSLMKSPGEWWYIFPYVTAIILMFICLIRPRGQVFEI